MSGTLIGNVYVFIAWKGKTTVSKAEEILKQVKKRKTRERLNKILQQVKKGKTVEKSASED